MINKKVLWISSSIIVLIATFVFCFNIIAGNKSYSSDSDIKIHFSESYNDLSSLKTQSDLVIIGKVLNVRQTYLKEDDFIPKKDDKPTVDLTKIPLTLCEIEVKKSYGENEQKGTIEILKFNSDDSILIEKDKEYLMFLTKSKTLKKANSYNLTSYSQGVLQKNKEGVYKNNFNEKFKDSEIEAALNK